MRNVLKIVVAVIVAFSLGTSSALAACKTIPPNEWEGGFMVGTGSWVTGLTFRENNCSLDGVEQLNGFDALVVEVEGYGGLPALVEYTAVGVQVGAFSGTFFTEECQAQESIGLDADTPLPIVIPENAHSLIFEGAHGATNVEVKMESEGKQCGKKKTKKKKKKGKNRSASMPTSETVHESLSRWTVLAETRISRS